MAFFLHILKSSLLRVPELLPQPTFLLLTGHPASSRSAHHTEERMSPGRKGWPKIRAQPQKSLVGGDGKNSSSKQLLLHTLRLAAETRTGFAGHTKMWASTFWRDDPCLTTSLVKSMKPPRRSSYQPCLQGCHPKHPWARGEDAETTDKHVSTSRAKRHLPRQPLGAQKPAPLCSRCGGMNSETSATSCCDSVITN